MQNSKTINYNKLVRDYIPNVIMNDSNTASVKYREIDDDTELIKLLLDKLCEEANELRESYNLLGEKSLEEIADVQEVLNKLLVEFDFSRIELEKIMSEKRMSKGGFDLGIYLEQVTSK